MIGWPIACDAESISGSTRTRNTSAMAGGETQHIKMKRVDQVLRRPLARQKSFLRMISERFLFS